jgi:hypothetical protein
VYKVEQEHKAHAEHERHANDGALPEVPGYEFLNRRVKPFPWGMNSLFFNPEVRTARVPAYVGLTPPLQVNKDLTDAAAE